MPPRSPLPTLALKLTKHHSKNARRLQKRKDARSSRTAVRWTMNVNGIGYENLALRQVVNGILPSGKKTITLVEAAASIAEECMVVFQDTRGIPTKTAQIAEIATEAAAVVVAEVVVVEASAVVEEIIWHLMVTTTLQRQ